MKWLGGVIVAVDQGKSGTRATAYDPASEVPLAEAATEGFDYSSSTSPDQALVISVVRAVGALRLPSAPDGIAIVSTAAPQSREGARDCAGVIARRTGARRLLLAEDVVGAHLGALGGRPGVVVSAGTGSVSLWTDGVTVRRVDGWGPLLGDDGSGFDIGSRGLRAAFAANDGRGPDTMLASLACAFLGPLGQDTARLLHARRDAIPFVSRFAPAVSRAAEDGDEVAARILDKAGRRLAATACTAARSPSRESERTPASYTGKVFQSQPVLDSFLRHCEKGGLRVHQPVGDNLAGALQMVRGRGAHMFATLIAEAAD